MPMARASQSSAVMDLIMISEAFNTAVGEAGRGATFASEWMLNGYRDGTAKVAFR